jgi:hypothetical protein
MKNRPICSTGQRGKVTRIAFLHAGTNVRPSAGWHVRHRGISALFEWNGRAVDGREDPDLASEQLRQHLL